MIIEEAFDRICIFRQRARHIRPPRNATRQLDELVRHVHSEGDRGARAILERHSFRLVRVPMPNAAVDLDTPEDLATLTQRFNIGEP